MLRLRADSKPCPESLNGYWCLCFFSGSASLSIIFLRFCTRVERTYGADLQVAETHRRDQKVSGGSTLRLHPLPFDPSPEFRPSHLTCPLRAAGLTVPMLRGSSLGFRSDFRLDSVTALCLGASAPLAYR